MKLFLSVPLVGKIVEQHTEDTVHVKRAKSQGGRHRKVSWLQREHCGGARSQQLRGGLVKVIHWETIIDLELQRNRHMKFKPGQWGKFPCFGKFPSTVSTPFSSMKTHWSMNCRLSDQISPNLGHACSLVSGRKREPEYPRRQRRFHRVPNLLRSQTLRK